MTMIYSGASMSLDGYIAGPDVTGFDLLFDWMTNGTVEIQTADPNMTMRPSEASAPRFRAFFEAGCLVVGRKLFDITNGWGGKHTLGVPVVVLTHSVPDGWEREGEWFTFVTEGGIEAAVETAKRIAGDKDIAVNGGEMATQALEAGLLDELWIELVPVLLGGGTPLVFPGFDGAPASLDGPVEVIEGNRVTHLRYVIRKAQS
jgi:dihydrofolate reductase